MQEITAWSHALLLCQGLGVLVFESYERLIPAIEQIPVSFQVLFLGTVIHLIPFAKVYLTTVFKYYKGIGFPL